MSLFASQHMLTGFLPVYSVFLCVRYGVPLLCVFMSDQHI